MAIYLKIKGLNGAVTAKLYQSSINIYGYQLSAGRSTDAMDGVISNRVLGQLTYNSLILEKDLDGASVGLLGHLHDGDTIKAVEFHHVTAETQACFLINTFHNVVIANIEEAHSSSGSTERIHLYFTKSEKKYTQYDSAGRISTPQATGYDLKKAVTI